MIALDVALPNDPIVLYDLAWVGYVGYGAASGTPGHRADERHFVDLAAATGNRLLAVEANDNALKSFTANVQQSQAQLLSTAGDHAKAIATERRVIALFESALAHQRKSSTLNRLTASHYAMGNISRAAGNRDLACENYHSAAVVLADLDKRRELLGSVKHNRAAVEQNVALCAAGAPISQMNVLD